MRPLLVVWLVVLCACEGRLIGAPLVVEAPPAVTTPTPTPTPIQTPQQPIAEARVQVTGPEAIRFARRVAPMLVGRVPTEAELARLASGGAAWRDVLSTWVAEAGFADAARDWISVKLKASGTKDGVNGDLPGNLAAHLVRTGRPHGELLTADRCYDRAGQPTACDSGAPFTAGVLTTRAFLKTTASRFNLKRARTVLATFGCAEYPLDPVLQPPLAREQLIPLFQVDQLSDTSAGAFGNGFACYTCHSQFSAHAQLFVKFDDQGLYRAAATGLQDPMAEQGRSTNGLFTSHLVGDAAGREHSQVFGRPVQNLAEGARVIAESPLFLECSVRSWLGYALGLSESEAKSLPASVVKEIVSEATRQAAQPTLAQLVVEAFSHPSVVRAVRGAATSPVTTP
jgi:hypothetical protein